ncbi:class I SAM-dependent methyltransferase [Caldalkalibacillus salinus]|uniref:class I SAM-dependent methyltransferase n=1 Tax=Caldalkalibacillus salinus TaxID=2803787 RepID=UPI0019230AD5|nr:class I SAM-dependent methyltransferase [Caldalkalibacillus salinus]
MIDFHDARNRMSYTTREASSTWTEDLSRLINMKGSEVLDIGAGGGIYSKAIIDNGAHSVTVLDASEAMLEGAQANCEGYEQIHYVHAEASDTHLPSQSYDIVLQRALIHHLKQLRPPFTEAYRLLKDRGMLIIQDRTPGDCLLPSSQTHIRGFIFECFPHLASVECRRRYESEDVHRALRAAGFKHIQEEKLWEGRKTYHSVPAMVEELKARTGRSILHHLDDQELDTLCTFIKNRVKAPVTEMDRWTIWVAQKRS